MFAWALRRVCKAFEIVCLRVCMLIKAILVIIFIKAQYVKPFGGFYLTSVVLTISCLLLIVIPYKNSEQDTGKILALKMSH